MYLPIQLLAPQSWLLGNRNGLFPPPGASCIGLHVCVYSRKLCVIETYKLHNSIQKIVPTPNNILYVMYMYNSTCHSE